MILLEGAKMGGDCLNCGRVLSKALLAAVKIEDELDARAKTGDAQTP